MPDTECRSNEASMSRPEESMMRRRRLEVLPWRRAAGVDPPSA